MFKCHFSQDSNVLIYIDSGTRCPRKMLSTNLYAPQLTEDNYAVNEGYV